MPQTKTPAGADQPSEQTPTKPGPATDARPTPPASKADSASTSTVTSPATNSADQAVADAVRQAEIEQLTRQRDELRDKLGEGPDDLALLRAEVDALQQAAARAGVSLGRDRMSAGVASDLEQQGYAIDPATGAAYVRDGDNVTVTTRTGETSSIPMLAPSTARPRE